MISHSEMLAYGNAVTAENDRHKATVKSLGVWLRDIQKRCPHPEVKTIRGGGGEYEGECCLQCDAFFSSPLTDT